MSLRDRLASRREVVNVVAPPSEAITVGLASRSEAMMVAVGLSPRTGDGRRMFVA
jgi:hypothetical protein